MREIVIISGKGGTGKTSLTAAFAHLAENKVLCDLDVDAPDLHILLDPKIRKQEDFVSGHIAEIDPDKCTACGTCMDMCRYGGVVENDGVYAIDPLRCEGCKVCVEFCPEGAVKFNPSHCGQWMVSSTRFGTMVHAQLFPGEENSGLLVSLLKRQARAIAEQEGRDLILCDGAPGIGCPVISSLSGTDLAVIVTEPTPSGSHDMMRVAELCGHFKVKPVIIINKCDLNPEIAEGIESYACEQGFAVVARLPHDPAITLAMVERKAVTEVKDNTFAHHLREAWDAIRACLDEVAETQ